MHSILSRMRDVSASRIFSSFYSPCLGVVRMQTTDGVVSRWGANPASSSGAPNAFRGLGAGSRIRLAEVLWAGAHPSPSVTNIYALGTVKGLSPLPDERLFLLGLDFARLCRGSVCRQSLQRKLPLENVFVLAILSFM